MKRPGYREAIQWLVDNDDTEWANTENAITQGRDPVSVSGALVADLFGVTDSRVRLDVSNKLKKGK